jgi:pilus assembly protein CpaC
MRSLLARTLSVTAIAALSLGAALPVADAADYGANQASAAGQLNARFLPLGIGKSIVIDLPRDVKDVLVADPKIANAVVRSAQRAYIIGATVGQTNIIFFDSAGQQIAAYDIAVTRDLNGIRGALKQAMPTADIRVEGLGDGIMLMGSAASQEVCGLTGNGGQARLGQRADHAGILHRLQGRSDGRTGAE